MADHLPGLPFMSTLQMTALFSQSSADTWSECNWNFLLHLISVELILTLVSPGLRGSDSLSLQSCIPDRSLGPVLMSPIAPERHSGKCEFHDKILNDFIWAHFILAYFYISYVWLANIFTSSVYLFTQVISCYSLLYTLKSAVLLCWKTEIAFYLYFFSLLYIIISLTLLGDMQFYLIFKNCVYV